MKPLHRPNLKAKTPRPVGLRFVALEQVKPPKMSRTANTPVVGGKLAWSSTRSKQAVYHVRIPTGTAPGLCTGLYSEDQTVIKFSAPMQLVAGHEFACDPRHPMRLERFGNRMPKLYAGFMT